MVNRKNRILIGIAIMVALVVGIYLYSQYNPEKYSLFPKCPVYTATGYQCPGCGSQRAFHHLFQGDFLTALMYNPFIIFLVPYVLLGVYIEYIANRNNPRISHVRSIFFGKWAILAIAVITLFYTVFRNIYS